MNWYNLQGFLIPAQGSVGFLCFFLRFFLSLKNKTTLVAERLVLNPSFHQELDVCNSKSLRKEYSTWHKDSVMAFALN